MKAIFKVVEQLIISQIHMINWRAYKIQMRVKEAQ